MPPPSSGGTVLLEMLNILEGYDLKQMDANSSDRYHLTAEAMRSWADATDIAGYILNLAPVRNEIPSECFVP